MISGQHHAPTGPATSFFHSALARLDVNPRSTQGKHAGLREGTKLGLIVATVTWLWLALIDAVSGAPFHTSSALGGVVAFTLAHYALNVAYGVSLVSLIRGAVRYPSLILVALTAFAMIEIGFIMLTAALSYFLGGIAWLSIFGGSIIGAVIALQFLVQRHPLEALLHEAENER